MPPINPTATTEVARRLAIDLSTPGARKMADLAVMRDSLGSSHRMVVMQGGTDRVRITFVRPSRIDADSVGPYLTPGRVARIELLASLDVSSTGGALSARIEDTGTSPKSFGGLTVGITGLTGTFSPAGKDIVLPRVPAAGRGLVPRVRIRSAIADTVAAPAPAPAPAPGPAPAPAAALAAPSLSAAAISATAIRLFAQPAGTQAVGVRVYRKAAAGGARTLVGTITPPAAWIDDTGRTTGAQVWYDAASVDGTGVESAFSAERSAIAQAVTAAQITTLRLHNPPSTPNVRYTGADVANPIVPFGMAFAPGDLPPGAAIELRKADGTVLATQQGQESSHPDGSVAFLAGDVAYSGTLAAGETATLQVWRKSSAPDRTRSVTPAQVIASSDFRIECSGGTLGADVLVASVNDILQNGTEAALGPATKWGANPNRGWQVERSGPLGVLYHCWGALRRTGDGAIDKQLRADFWFHAYTGGKFRIWAEVSQPLCNGIMPGGTIGPDLPLRRACVVALKNGNTTLMVVGGPADPRTCQIPGANFDPGSNLINWTGPNSDRGMCFRFTGGNPMPGGVSPDWYYYLDWVDGKRRLHPHRFFALRGESPGDISSAGGGTITATVYASIHWQSVIQLCGQRREHLWVGAPAHDILTAQDTAYLAHKTRAVPTYDLTLSFPAHRDWTPDFTNNMEPPRLQRSLREPGDSADDERIGYLSHSETRALIYHPLDYQTRIKARLMTYWTAQFGTRLLDPTTGEALNVANPNFPGLGASRPIYISSDGKVMDQSNRSSPLRQMRDAGINPLDHMTGMDSGYDPYFDASHGPNHVTGWYIASGDPVAREHMVGLMVNQWAANSRDENWGGTIEGATGATYNNCYLGPKQGQVREKGWGYRYADNLVHLLPDAHVVKPYAKYALDHTIGAWNAYIPPANNAMSARMRNLGLPGEDWDMSGSFHDGILSQALGMMRWRGHYGSALETMWSFWKRRMVDYFDPQHPLDGTTNGCLTLMGDYFLYVRHKSYNVDPWNQSRDASLLFSQWKRVFDWRAAKREDVNPVNPEVPGAFVCNNTIDPNENYIKIQRAALSLHAMAGDQQARRLFDLVQSKANGGAGFTFSDGRLQQAIKIPG